MGPKTKPANKAKQLQQQPSVTKRKGAKKQDEDDLGLGDFGEDFMQERGLVKPDDQLELTDEELKEEFTRILTANNPHAPDNIVRFHFKEGVYKAIPAVDQLVIHFSIDGQLLHQDSDEARKQRNRNSIAEHKDQRTSTSDQHPTTAEVEAQNAEEENGEEEEAQQTAEIEEGDKDHSQHQHQPAPKSEALRNQFNFSERAAQTANNPFRERSSATEPPPRADFAGSVNQWAIYDAYSCDLASQEKAKDKAVKIQSTSKKDEEKSKKKIAAVEVASDDISRVSQAAKIVERMVNQNTYDDIAQDFSYFEDISDEYRESEGTLLPLWKFSYDKIKRLTVTAICWNPKHYDLFAAGHGSYDFSKQAQGLILLYSLKNPSYPEYIYSTESGVMSLDIHPEYQYLICVGLYDGNVAVYNVKITSDIPTYQSFGLKGKHSDPVWQVKWQKDDFDGKLNFFSISSDGRVLCWTLNKNELVHKVVMVLNMETNPTEICDKSKQLLNRSCGTSFAFHKTIENLFLVGTEGGEIHKCSKAYSSRFLGTIKGHHMNVDAVRWNPFHPDIFISCSADWTVKIWDNNYKEQAMFTFDFNCQVGDVAWAPYSSTVFAAVTAEGKVHVYDLNTNKYEPLCKQSVVQKKRTKLTHIEFNPKHKIIIVSDDRGNVTSLKLSPNLRKMPKVKKGQKPPPIDPAAEIEKLDKILRLVREPDFKEN